MNIISQLLKENKGAALVEFAIIIPVLLLIVFGLADLAHALYTRSLLQGAIEKASRASTIEGAATAVLDNRVSTTVLRIAPKATLNFSRKSYAQFSDINKQESFTDGNSDGICNNGEPFEDANANGAWDADQGRNGNGGAQDAILYTVTVNYPRMFPVGKFLGQSPNMQLVISSVLRNQPYGPRNMGTNLSNC